MVGQGGGINSSWQGVASSEAVGCGVLCEPLANDDVFLVEGPPWVLWAGRWCSTLNRAKQNVGWAIVGQVLQKIRERPAKVLAACCKVPRISPGRSTPGNGKVLDGSEEW